MLVAPSVLGADFANMGQAVIAADKAGADIFHLDVMDGHFVPNITLGADMIKAIRPLTKLPFEAHMMVTNPEMWLDSFAEAGIKRFLIHFESEGNIYRLIQKIKEKDLEAGIVINPGTTVATIKEFLPIVDQVLVMTVNPGFGGQKFIPQMADKVSELCQIKKYNHSNFKIEVDGGINDQTIAKVKEAGADIVVAGSYVFGDPASMKERIASLK